MRFVDLHTHTTESDGTFTPEELVQAAIDGGISTLAITDHDTFSGFEAASEYQAGSAAEGRIELIRGIELTCKHSSGNVHLLGYFFDSSPPLAFIAWLEELLDSRRERNGRLEQRLQELGVDVSVEEAEKYGRRITGRPHFARVLVAKGYASTLREAFDKYVGELGQAYVERESPTVAEAVERMLDVGGVPSLAHPIRIRGNQESAIAEFAAAGLPALEAFHSDQGAADTKRYLGLADKYGLAVSGGSDFHGANKPRIDLGRGINGNLRVPEWVVPALRARSR